MSYPGYRKLVEILTKNGQTTGNSQEESLVYYTKLNNKRMARLDKTITLPEEAIKQLKAYKGNITWLILTESWCGDAAQTLPVMYKMAALNARIDMKIVLRDENEALMEQFLTRGARSLPKLIMINNPTGEVLHTWGPRPSTATKMVNEFKERHGKLTPEFREALQVWYNKDKGENTVEDLLELLQ